jgi:hypothetical protein
MFLQYEASQPKVCLVVQGKSMPLTPAYQQRKCGNDSGPDTIVTVGLSHIKQAITTLEYWCFTNQCCFKHNLETQKPLCSDPQVSRFKSAAGHDKPKCVKEVIILKGVGTPVGEVFPPPLVTLYHH